MDGSDSILFHLRPEILPEEFIIDPKMTIGWNYYNENSTTENIQNYIFELLDVSHFNLINECKVEKFPKASEYGLISKHWLKFRLQSSPLVFINFFRLDKNSIDLMKISEFVSLSSSLYKETTSQVLCLNFNNFSPSSVDLNKLSVDISQVCKLNPKNIYFYDSQDQNSKHNFTSWIFGTCRENISKIIQSYQQRSSARETSPRVNIGVSFKSRIKIALYCEIKQDFQAAIRNYTLAFSEACELKNTYPDILELFHIAGIITYKIIILQFRNKSAADAIIAFENMINFGSKIGAKIPNKAELDIFLGHLCIIFINLIDQYNHNNELEWDFLENQANFYSFVCSYFSSAHEIYSNTDSNINLELFEITPSNFIAKMPLIKMNGFPCDAGNRVKLLAASFDKNVYNVNLFLLGFYYFMFK